MGTKLKCHKVSAPDSAVTASCDQRKKRALWAGEIGERFQENVGLELNSEREREDLDKQEEKRGFQIQLV